MLSFLKGFLSNLNAVQSKQILRILGQMRDKGEIRTAKEFEGKLAELANLIEKDKLIQRTPFLTYGEGEVLESDAIRTFLEMTRLDLEAALGETERLGNSIRAHNRILVENYFDSMEAALTELESEVRAYEVLETRKYTGFSSVVKKWVFDGAISVPGADKNDPLVSSLFEDSRGGEILKYSPPGNGEPGLHLGTSGSHRSLDYFSKVEILTDSTTPQTALSTATEENTPVKAIDGDRDTSWRSSLLLTEHPDYCRLVFAPSFIGAQRVSAIVVEALSDVAMKVVSISYIDSGGNEVSLPIGTSYAGSTSTLYDHEGHLGTELLRAENFILPNRNKVFPVGDIIARKFIITLQQDTAGDGEFFYYDSDLGSWSHDTYMEDIISGHMREDGGSDGMEIPVEFGFIDGFDEAGKKQARFAEYIFGLKNIYTFTRAYYSNGLFVPESFEMPNAPRVLALHSDTYFPSNENTDIEFLLRKENFTADGLLSDVETIPMLPYGTSTINERLFLTELQVSSSIKDSGILRFYPDFSSSFTIYRGSEALVLGSDYYISVDGGTTFESSSPPSETPNDPPRCLIRVKAPQAGVIYSVSYTPLVSSSEAGGEVWLNVDHTVRLGRYQTYVFNNERPSGSISRCKLGLQILLRANTLNTRVSPYLRELVLLGGM